MTIRLADAESEKKKKLRYLFMAFKFKTGITKGNETMYDKYILKGFIAV